MLSLLLYQNFSVLSISVLLTFLYYLIIIFENFIKMSSTKILIIEDEKDIVELLFYNLRKESFEVDFAYNGEEGLTKIRNNSYDLVILDLMLPGIGGFELCKILREDPKTSHTPIIMLTARTLESDKILGLELGADDYITKPFSFRELIARIKALLRRVNRKSKENIIKIGNLYINKDKYQVKIENKPIILTPLEFKILSFLAERKGKICSRKQIINEVWGEEGYANPKTIDVHIKRIRNKIEKDPANPVYIKTLRGVGYYIPEEV